MHLVIKNIAILFVIALLGACSSLRFPGVYRVVVQQGNFLEQEMVDQLEVGMSREQVRYIMGTPMVEDTFNFDRWDYYFDVKRGDEILKKYHFKVHFQNNQLASWEGDYRKNEEQMDSTTGSSDLEQEDSNENTGSRAVKEATDQSEN